MPFDNIYDEVAKYEINELIYWKNYLDDSLPEIPRENYDQIERYLNNISFIDYMEDEIYCCNTCYIQNKFPNNKWIKHLCVFDYCDFKPILIDPKWFYNILKYKSFIIKCQKKIKQRYYKNKMLQNKSVYNDYCNVICKYL